MGSSKFDFLLKNLFISIPLSLLFSFFLPIFSSSPFTLSIPNPLSSSPLFVLDHSSLLSLLISLLSLYALSFLYNLFFTPLHYFRKAGETQFPSVIDQKEEGGGRGKILMESRRLGDFPPPFPNGWWVLCHSSDLAKGQVKVMNVLGGQYVLWREDNDKGLAHLWDAYCPHMGANLAFGGTVNGENLKCPFHNWEFNGTGACSKVPYANEPVKHAKAKTHTIIEQNQLIVFWHDAEGREPWWFPPTHPEIESGKFVFHGRTEHHVLAHIQELPENGADVPHLNTVHEGVYFGVRHSWQANWQPIDEKELANTEAIRSTTASPEDKRYRPGEHWTQINLIESVHLAGRKINFLDIKVHINQIGPGIVWLRFFTPFGQALVCGAATPFAPMVQRTYHLIYAEKSIPRVLAKFMVHTLGKFYEQDVMIWQWKTYPKQPTLSKEDESIKRFRRWFGQFYSENSISFNDAVAVYSKGRNALPLDW